MNFKIQISLHIQQKLKYCWSLLSETGFVKIKNDFKKSSISWSVP